MLRRSRASTASRWSTDDLRGERTNGRASPSRFSFGDFWGSIVATALTVDFEEWFHICGFAGEGGSLEGRALPSRAEPDAERLLSLFDRHGIRATFFCVGTVAARHPAAVRRIAAQGHEIASHGWEHHEAFRMSREELRDDVTRAKAFLEDLTGQEVSGYRAPAWSIRKRNRWAWDALVEAGYRYDSSPLLPMLGVRDSRRLGAPLPVFPVLHFPTPLARTPVGAGIFLRMAPARVVEWAIATERRRGNVAVLGLHPWELDPDPPRAPMGVWHHFVHYGGLSGLSAKLHGLLGNIALDCQPLRTYAGRSQDRIPNVEFDANLPASLPPAAVGVPSRR